jgi:HEAT repeat protein
MTATRDTSSQVRAAAVSSLLSTGSLEALARARELWDKDTSYAVKAAALGTLARLDQGNTAALIRTGLHTHSYQDAIADAALGIIAQSNDTTMIDEVDQAVGTSRNAAFVLGVFAARGNSRAMELLSQLVSSPRATVRKRALQAFQFVVPPPLARERLTALSSTASSDRIKTEIQGTIDRLKS